MTEPIPYDILIKCCPRNICLIGEYFPDSCLVWKQWVKDHKAEYVKYGTVGYVKAHLSDFTS
jgi:hypothetical protein